MGHSFLKVKNAALAGLALSLGGALLADPTTATFRNVSDTTLRLTALAKDVDPAVKVQATSAAAGPALERVEEIFF